MSCGECSGKFGDKVAAKLHRLSLGGFCDEEYGCCTEAPGRWWGLIGKSILTEDSQGFVDAEVYVTREEAQANFERIVGEVDAEMDEANAL